VGLRTHLLDLLAVMLLEDCFSQLGGAEILLACRFADLFLRSGVFVHYCGHSLDSLIVHVARPRFALDCDLDLALKLHVGLDLSVDGQVAQA
jgi:hypothetical protein